MQNFIMIKIMNYLRIYLLILDQGQVLSILGPNGVGKTSLIRCICDFEK